ncbi:hypothetical protein Xen7305DRAFT_00000650 [Xenococcus sp. PCC 7305]|nr:hypothetical protein [Xenococcus sp. PCC 7305]ELS00365.1 hypothetical protein Xen7305DRAFT_00000650 [Xenococcus sp. PCC 7305]
MFSIIHAAIAVSATYLTFRIGTDNPVVLGLAIFGSQFSDLN